MLVAGEGCSGLARMVWLAGCAWGHSVGSTTLIFMVPPSIVSHVEEEGRGGQAAALSILQPMSSSQSGFGSQESPNGL